MASDLPDLMTSLEVKNQLNSSFLLLPRELRDMIYRLVAKTERRIYLRVAMRKGTKPLKAVFTLGGQGQTNSQLKSEYTAVLESRTRQLIRGGKGYDELLCPGMYSEEEGSATLQMCRSQSADGTYTLTTRSLTLTMPWEFHGRAVREDVPARRRTTAGAELLVASFEIADCKNVKLPCRRYFTGSGSRGSWDANHSPQYWWPKGSRSAMRQLSAAVKTTDWEGSMPLFALWHTYGGAIAWMMREKDSRANQPLRSRGRRFMEPQTGPSKTKDQDTSSHLLRLPRELRDWVFDYVALSEEGLNLRIEMTKGRNPQKIVFALTGLSRTSSQLKTEYFAALERRMKGLMGKGDLLGLHLADRGWMQSNILDRKPRLYVSRTLHPDGSFAQNVHKLTVPVQLIAKTTGDNANFVRPDQVDRVVIVSFTLDEPKVLETRLSFDGPRDPRRLAGIDRYETLWYKFPHGIVAAMEQIVAVAKAVDWKGSLNHYMMWQQYVVQFTRQAYFREESREEAEARLTGHSLN